MTAEDLLNAQYPCIYQLLEELRFKSGASSIAVIHQEAADWTVDFQFPEGGDIEDFAARVGPSLETDSRATGSLIALLAGRDSRRRLLAVPVVFRTLASADSRSHFVVFVDPIWLSLGDTSGCEEYATWSRRLILSWFAWTCYAREERRRFCESMRREPGALSARMPIPGGALPWPTPFGEVLHLVEAAWPENDGERGDEWLDAVMRSACVDLDGGCLKCRIPGIDGHPCEAQAERRNFRAAAKFLRWRIPSVMCSRGDAIDRALEEIAALEIGCPEGAEIGALDVPLDSGSLWRFFAAAFWREWIQRRADWSLTDSEKRECLRATTHLAQHLLANMPLDAQTIEDMVWAIARYGHDSLDIEPRLDIASHLLHAARAEPALHSLKEYYRDHFFHALQVCFLGHLLLTRCRTGSGRLLIDLARSIMRVDSNRAVLREWYVASISHDVGYGIEVLRAAETLLEFHERSQDLRRLADGIGGLVEKLSADLGSRGFLGFTAEDKPGKDHGVVGAEHLASLLDHIRKRKPLAHAYRDAIEAVAVHNYVKRKVSFSDKPLSFLLILCDGIQEWNRSRLLYTSAPETMLARTFHSCERDDSCNPLSSARLEGSTGGDRLTFRLRYSEAVNHNSNVFHIWLDISSNLQRLDFDGFPFDVNVEITTPYHGSGSRMVSQLDRLKQAARETHMNFLAPWFPRPDNRAVRHAAGDRCDIITLDVRELIARHPVTASMGTFATMLRRWSGYNEDRLFTGDYAPAHPG